MWEVEGKEMRNEETGADFKAFLVAKCPPKKGHCMMEGVLWALLPIISSPSKKEVVLVTKSLAAQQGNLTLAPYVVGQEFQSRKMAMRLILGVGGWELGPDGGDTVEPSCSA